MQLLPASRAHYEKEMPVVTLVPSRPFLGDVLT